MSVLFVSSTVVTTNGRDRLRHHRLRDGTDLSPKLPDALTGGTCPRWTNCVAVTRKAAVHLTQRSVSSTPTSRSSAPSLNSLPTIDISTLHPHHVHPSSPYAQHAPLTRRRTRTRTRTPSPYPPVANSSSPRSSSPPPSPTVIRRPLRDTKRRSFSDLQQQAAPSIDAPSRRRKPHGYWNQLENVERELLLVNAQLGFAGRRMIPRIVDMQALGRGDLVAALMKHGGVRKVAETLRWGRAPRLSSLKSSSSSSSSDTSTATGSSPASSIFSSSSSSSSTLSSPLTTLQVTRHTSTVPTTTKCSKVREKLQRRPVAYWKDVERVHCEMSAFIEEYGARGVMPTRKQLYKFGRSDLANAAERHGGLRVIARQMGLRGRKDVKPRGFWSDFNAVRDALIEFSKQNSSGKMPTADELHSGGMGCLINAIAAHGGFPSVAKRCGFKARNSKKQGAPLLWDEMRVKREYLSFLMTFYPDLAKQRIMVSERHLRKHGRNDLSYAIQKIGGFAVLAKMLGLKKKSFRGQNKKIEQQ